MGQRAEHNHSGKGPSKFAGNGVKSGLNCGWGCSGCGLFVHGLEQGVEVVPALLAHVPIEPCMWLRHVLRIGVRKPLDVFVGSWAGLTLMVPLSEWRCSVSLLFALLCRAFGTCYACTR